MRERPSCHMTKFDPYKHKERYLAWKEKNQSVIPGISKENSDLTLHFLNDMEQGLNISSTSKKGARSYIRLNVLKQRLTSLSRAFEKRGNFSLFDCYSGYLGMASEEKFSSPFILDIDLDFFVKNEELFSHKFSIVSDTIIKKYLNLQKNLYLSNLCVGLTIALEPYYCGGLDNCWYILQKLSGEFEIDLTSKFNELIKKASVF